MKKITSILHWILPTLLVILLIALLVWQQNLSIPDGDHEWISIFMVIIFFVMINIWISRNPQEFLVGSDYLSQNSDEAKEKNDQAH